MFSLLRSCDEELFSFELGVNKGKGGHADIDFCVSAFAVFMVSINYVSAFAVFMVSTN